MLAISTITCQYTVKGSWRNSVGGYYTPFYGTNVCPRQLLLLYSSYHCYSWSAGALWVVQCSLSLVLIVGINNRYYKNKSLLLLLLYVRTSSNYYHGTVPYCTLSNE